MTPNEAKNQLSKYRNSPFREYQEEAINFIINSPKRFVFLEAPTGSGKSLIAMTSGISSGHCTYAVHSKSLQHQITTDFPEGQSLFGRANYECLLNPDLNCGECSHTKQTPCDLKNVCTYEIAKKKALDSNLRILNYDYLLTECNYIGKFSGGQFNIIDEADNLENTLINFVTLTFTDFQLSRLGLQNQILHLHKSSVNQESLIASWSAFASNALARAKEIMKKYDIEIGNFPSNLSESHHQTLKNRIRTVHLIEKIELFLDNVDSSWLFDDSQQGSYTFRPLWLTESLAEKFMWRHSQKWVLMSASFLPLKIECKRLGISIDEVDYKSLPSTFSVSLRPISIEPIANLTSKTMETEVPKLIKRISQIVSDHPNSKGLIHAVSYKLANQIIEGCRSPRIITHNSTDRQEKLEYFIESPDPLVLVSPSMERGISLEQDLCRFIIVAKAPFLYLGDKIVSARVYTPGIGKYWYAATMLLSVLQMTGRGFRSADDYCESYILDTQFQRVFSQNPSFLPQWWKEAVVW